MRELSTKVVRGCMITMLVQLKRKQRASKGGLRGKERVEGVLTANVARLLLVRRKERFKRVLMSAGLAPPTSWLFLNFLFLTVFLGRLKLFRFFLFIFQFLFFFILTGSF